MPCIFNVFGYKIYFWSNENGEPIHVHICKGVSRKNATKVWLTKEGKVKIAHNRSRISKGDLAKLLVFIQSNAFNIQQIWCQYFGYMSFYC
jgi:hypothetical protein